MEGWGEARGGALGTRGRAVIPILLHIEAITRALRSLLAEVQGEKVERGTEMYISTREKERARASSYSRSFRNFLFSLSLSFSLQLQFV